MKGGAGKLRGGGLRRCVFLEDFMQLLAVSHQIV